MKKTLIISALFLISLSSFSTVQAISPLYGKKIIVDPGHGGIDPGTTRCPLYTEAQANLDIAKKLEALLEDSSIGADAVLTRTDNETTLSNSDRYTLANEENGDAMVSIHLNGSTDHSINGTLGLYAKIKKDEEFTRTLHNKLVSMLDPEVPDLGITNFMSGVTLKSDMPATIQEAVYLSNTQECIRMTDGTGIRQSQIAQALFAGLEEWFSAPVSWMPPGKARKLRQD